MRKSQSTNDIAALSAITHGIVHAVSLRTPENAPETPLPLPEPSAFDDLENGDDEYYFCGYSAGSSYEEPLKDNAITPHTSRKLATLGLSTPPKPLPPWNESALSNSPRLRRMDSFSNFSSLKGTKRLTRSASFGSLEKAMITKSSRRVSFSTLSVREYALTLGDHPSCSRGPPIQLDWRFRNLGSINIDVFESGRELKGGRRTRRQLYMTKKERTAKLTDLGLTGRELDSSENEIRKIKSQRRSSTIRSQLPSYNLEVAAESAVRKIKRVFSSKEEKRLRREEKARVKEHLRQDKMRREEDVSAGCWYYQPDGVETVAESSDSSNIHSSDSGSADSTSDLDIYDDNNGLNNSNCDDNDTDEPDLCESGKVFKKAAKFAPE